MAVQLCRFKNRIVVQSPRSFDAMWNQWQLHSRDWRKAMVTVEKMGGGFRFDG
jgi:hypothetical protein